jgi:hypothetical protein
MVQHPSRQSCSVPWLFPQGQGMKPTTHLYLVLAEIPGVARD